MSLQGTCQVLILFYYAVMLIEKKPTKTFYLLKINFRKREHKKSQTVDVQESQCGDTPYVSNNDVMSTEYQQLRDRRTQIYENLS